jgi:hypothetical protein
LLQSHAVHRSSGILFVIGASGAGRTAAVSELAFITAATADIREMRASMVLLDCSPEVRASRLAFRGRPEPASAQMDSWVAYLRGQADAPSLPDSGHQRHMTRSGESLLRRSTAFAPVAMSLAALLIVLVRIAVVGTAPEPDEGAAAHLWQLLMVLQVPVVILFAMRWVPQAPGKALPILGLQAGAALAAMAPVFLLRW